MHNGQTNAFNFFRILGSLYCDVDKERLFPGRRTGIFLPYEQSVRKCGVLDYFGCPVVLLAALQHSYCGGTYIFPNNQFSLTDASEQPVTATGQ
jgi:hypothetical protein